MEQNETSGVVLKKIEKHYLFEKCVASITGGLLSVLVLTPFDVVKNRIQARSLPSLLVLDVGNNLSRNNVSSFRVARAISSEEGIGQLWRGFGPSLIMIPSVVIYFTMYDTFREKLTLELSGNGLFNRRCSNSPYVNYDASVHSAPLLRASVIAPMCAGLFSRTINVILFAPFEYLRTHIQSNPFQPSSNSSWRTLRQATNGGLRSWRVLWTGVGPTLWRDVPFSAIYWTSYEFCKRTFVRSFWPNYSPNDSKVLLDFSAGAFSGALAAFLTTPMDLIKTRIQKNPFQIPEGQAPLSSLEILKVAWKRGGLSELFQGAGVRVSKSAPSCAIMISCYEAVKLYIRREETKRGLLNKL